MMREPTDIRRQQAQRAVQALRARVDRLDDDAIENKLMPLISE